MMMMMMMMMLMMMTVMMMMMILRLENPKQGNSAESEMYRCDHP